MSSLLVLQVKVKFFSTDGKLLVFWPLICSDMQCTCGDVSLRNTIALFFILALCLVVHLSVVFAMTFY